MVRLIMLVLFHASSSVACSKFIHTDNVLGDIKVCKQLHMVTNGICDELSILSEINDHKKLKFMYQLYNYVHTFGIPCMFLVSSAVRRCFALTDVEFLTLKNNCGIFIKNVIYICSEIEDLNVSNSGGGRKCSNLKKFVEYLEAVVYLCNYGYIDVNINREHPASSIISIYKAGVIEFQKFFSLNMSGLLDIDTLNTMRCPRYNFPDIDKNIFRYKRYALCKNKWRKLNLTYRISRYPKKISRKMIDDEIFRAFFAWTSVSNLTIQKTKFNNADIIVRFEKQKHGDIAPFDGPGEVLAHTFYPITIFNRQQNSFIHFDSAEKWTANSEAGVNLYQVAVHEIGHALGLKHSTVQDSVMWPKHNGYNAHFTLHADDISAIQALYGSKINN